MSSESVEVFSMVQGHLVSSTVDLFRSFDFTLEHCSSSEPPVTDDRTLASIIGYAGESVRGALVLAAQVDAVRQWHVAFGGDGAEADAADTIGEFSNMLLGRLKVQLIREGILILLATPTTAIGGSIALASAASSWLSFRAPSFRVSVRIDASFEDGGRVRRAPISQPPAEAGEALFF